MPHSGDSNDNDSVKRQRIKDKEDSGLLKKNALHNLVDIQANVNKIFEDEDNEPTKFNTPNLSQINVSSFPKVKFVKRKLDDLSKTPLSDNASSNELLAPFYNASNSALDNDNRSSSSVSANKKEYEYKQTKKIEYYQEKCDLFEYPTQINTCTSNQIAVGDLHGNILKLIHFMIKEGVMLMDKETYAELVRIYKESCSLHINIPARIAQVFLEHGNNPSSDFYYNKLTADFIYEFCEKTSKSFKSLEERSRFEHERSIYPGFQKLTPENLNKFNQILGKITFEKKLPQDFIVKLIGDDVMDRSGNDYFMLKLFECLDKNNVPFEVKASNHGVEFNKAIEQGLTGFTSTLYKIGQANSFAALQVLCSENPSIEKEVEELYRLHYKKHLKLCSYSLTKDGITLFTHAPIGLDSIKNICNVFECEYNDSTKEKLAATIDNLNLAFYEKALEQNKMTYYYDKYVFKHNGEWWSILGWLLLTRYSNTYSEFRPSLHNEFKITYVHGHDGSPGQYTESINLNSDLGKYPCTPGQSQYPYVAVRDWGEILTSSNTLATGIRMSSSSERSCSSVSDSGMTFFSSTDNATTPRSDPNAEHKSGIL